MSTVSEWAQFLLGSTAITTGCVWLIRLTYNTGTRLMELWFKDRSERRELESKQETELRAEFQQKYAFLFATMQANNTFLAGQLAECEKRHQEKGTRLITPSP